MLFVLAFLSGFCLDCTWAACVKSVANGRALLSANLAVLFFLCSLVPPYLLVEGNLLPLVAYGLGCWFGTYSAVVWKRNG